MTEGRKGMTSSIVTLAGVHFAGKLKSKKLKSLKTWIPAFAGMTEERKRMTKKKVSK